MTPADLLYSRLHNQHLHRPKHTGAAAIVGWLGAVQAQDYAGAKWALGLRMPGITDAAIEQAFTDGTILRTHLMRPTWHFVTPADIGWLLMLTAPRVKVAMTHLNKQLGLDDATFKKSNKIIAKALEDGTQLTRAELGEALQHAKIATDDMRLTALAMNAELDGIICSGVRRGKQFTYALLAHRAPHARQLTRDQALAGLATRYFCSHGPATIQDFAWWSGLTLADGKAAIEMIKHQFIQEQVEGSAYWFSAAAAPAADHDNTAYLLPNFDEYIVSYKDRAALSAAISPGAGAPANLLFTNTVILHGQVIGTWKRTLKKTGVIVETTLFTKANVSVKKAISAAAVRYGEFLGLPVTLM